MKAKSITALALAAVMFASQTNVGLAAAGSDPLQLETADGNAVESGEVVSYDERAGETDWTQAPPLLVTEVVSDNPSGKRYTYTEVYNNSDAPINMSDYMYYYCYTGGMGTGKIFGDREKVSDHLGALYVGDYSTQDVMIEPGKTLVLWQNEKPTTKGYTLDDFNAYYHTDLVEGVDIVSVPYTGIHNSSPRGFYFGTGEDTIVVNAWSNEGGDAIPQSNPDKLAFQYEYPGTGNTCTVKEISAATPGSVSQDQVPPTRVHVNEGEIKIQKAEASTDADGNFQITAEIPFEGTKAAMFVNLYYRQPNGDEIPDYKQAVMDYEEDGKTFTFTIPAKSLYASQVEWYVSANNGGYADQTTPQSTTVTPRLPADEDAAPFYITEVGANEKSTADSGQYTFFEVYNQSDSTINLSYYKILYYYDYPAKTAAQSGKTWQILALDGEMEPGKTMVFWLTNNGTTIDQFNEFYGTDLKLGEDIVQVEYAGLHSTAPRWIRFGTSEEDAFTVAGFNQDSSQMLTASGLGLHYTAPRGENTDRTDPFRNASIPVQTGAATPGTVEEWQKSGQTVHFQGYTGYPEDDGEAPTLSVCQEENLPVPQSISEGETLKVMYDTDLLVGAASADRVAAFQDYIDENNPHNHPGGAEALKTRPYLIGTEIYYKLDDAQEWTVIQEKKQNRLGHFLMQIPADILFGHDQVTFKVKAYSLYGTSETQEHTVKINRLRNESGKIRLNVQDDQFVSGVQAITANDGAGNSDVTLKVNEDVQELTPMLEDGAYFMVQTADMDNYFKNAITAPYNGNERDIITILSPWCQLPLSRAVKIDNKYFTYNAETDSFDVEITLWAGDSGTPFEETLYPAVFGTNHEDYKVSGLQLRLANGESYLPTQITPDNEKTNTSTALDTWHTIGDSAGMETHLTASFSIPASQVDAKGFVWDTTKLSDGIYTVIAENTDQNMRQEASVIVDNTEPELNLGVSEGEVLYHSFILEEGTLASDANGVTQVTATLDGEELTLPAAIIPHEMTEGEHILAVAATDAAGNIAARSVSFTTAKDDPALLESGSGNVGDISANLSVQVGETPVDVAFYEGRSLTVENGGISIGAVTQGETGTNPYQLFTVNTGAVEEGEVLQITWKGEAAGTDETHKLTMFAKNVNSGKWKKIGTADENGQLKAQISASDVSEDGKATLLVQTVTEGTTPKISQAAEQTQELSEWDGSGRPQNYDFALAWETDTQYYAESFPYHYDNINQWIVDHAQEWKIRYVLHTGDIVDDVDMTGEWINADQSMQILDDAGMPYGVLGGNHDVYAGAEDYGNYWKYFGEDRFAGKDYYGGSYKNNLGHYDLLTENGQDLLILYMSWDIYTEEINWMNEVLAKYPNRKAIIALHRYANVKMVTEDSILDYTGELLQSEVVAKNPNVIAVLNGHYHGSSIQVDGFDDDGDGVKERTVYQICTDYQSDPEGGSEYIKFLYFDLTGNKIYINSYSPYRDDFNYYDNPKLESYEQGTVQLNQDIAELTYRYVEADRALTTESIEVDVRTTKLIGEVKDVSQEVSIQWTGLEPDTEYGWYAKVTNSRSGISYTKVHTFLTDKKAVVDPEPSKPSEPGASEPDNGGDSNQNHTSEKLTVGACYTVGKVSYRVLSVSSGTGKVAVAGSAVAKRKLTSLTIPSQVVIEGIPCNVTKIQQSAFAGYKKLKTVRIKANGLTSIGRRAFAGCTSLKSIAVDSKELRTIGKKAFYGDKKLTRITLKTKKLKKSSVGAKAFGKISKKAVFRVPAKKKSVYRKIFTARGAGKQIVVKGK